MDRQEALKRLEEIKTPSLFGDFVGYYGARDLIDEIYKTPLCLRNVLARLRELPEHDREVWLKGIMDEFELDFSHAKWREGYEQGKFDGVVEAEKSNKVVIPNMLIDFLERCRNPHSLLKNALMVEAKRFYEYVNQNDFSSSRPKTFFEWLDDYEKMEREKRYVVTDGNHLYFKKCQEDVEIVILADDMLGTMDDVKKFKNKDEAQKVADILGWKVQEVKI